MNNMITHQGYCRPLKKKVEFTVSVVESLDTQKGIKWLVRGNYETHKITTFTNKETAELLLSKLNNSAEEIEVFGAEIAVVEAESFEADTPDEMDTKCGICGSWEDCECPSPYDDEDWLAQQRAISVEGLDAKYIKKDGTPDKRYKVVREWLSNKDAEENVEAQAPEINSYDAEQMFSVEPSSIIYDECIPHEIWNAMDDSARGQYLATRDESLLVSPCCGVSKAEIRTNFDANEECGSCCFAGEDFLPEYWASEPTPSITQQYGAEGLDIQDTNANTAAIPNQVYYDMMLDLPDTITATQTDDGLTMILGFHNQDAELVDALIKTYAPPEDMGEPDTLYAEETYIHEAEPNVDMPVPTEPSTVNSALSFTPPETSLRDAEEFGSEGIERMSLEEYYSNVFSFSDNDIVQTNFNGEVIIQKEPVEMGAEESNLSFDDWAEEEDDGEGHKSNMTFEEWIGDEISEHGDVPLSQFKEDELKEPEHKDSENWQEEEIDWDAKDKAQEEEDIFEEVEWEAEGKKINKTLVGLLGIGALGAILAPKQIKDLFKKFNN